MPSSEGDSPDDEPDFRPEAILESLNAATNEDDRAYAEWARANPEAEYRTRLLGIPENKDMQTDAERQLRNVSRFVLFSRLEAGLYGVFTPFFFGLGIGSALGWENGIVNSSKPTTLICSAAGIASLGITKRIVRVEIPAVKARRQQEQELYHKYFGKEAAS